MWGVTGFQQVFCFVTRSHVSVAKSTFPKAQVLTPQTAQVLTPQTARVDDRDVQQLLRRMNLLMLASPKDME